MPVPRCFHPDNIYAMSRDGYDPTKNSPGHPGTSQEVEDYYTEKNVLGAEGRALGNAEKQSHAADRHGTLCRCETTGQDIKLRSVSWLVDNALDEIEKTNPKLKGILNRISQYQLGNEVLTAN